MLNRTEGICLSSHISYFTSSDPKDRAKVIWYNDEIWVYLVAMATILLFFFGKKYFFVLLYAFGFTILMELSNVDIKVNAQLSYGVFNWCRVPKAIIHLIMYEYNVIRLTERGDQQCSTSLSVMHLMHSAKWCFFQIILSLVVWNEPLRALQWLQRYILCVAIWFSKHTRLKTKLPWQLRPSIFTTPTSHMTFVAV